MLQYLWHGEGMLFLAIWECVSLQQKWRNAHFVENHVISRTFIHHLYMELKISHGSILFGGGGGWRPQAPPPPTSTPVRQGARMQYFKQFLVCGLQTIFLPIVLGG